MYQLDHEYLPFLKTAGLGNADAGHGNFLKQMRGSYRRGRIVGDFCQEVRMGESSAEVRGGFPDGVVQIGRAVAKSSVKLSGNEARLPLHELCVVLPGLEKSRLIGF